MKKIFLALIAFVFVTCSLVPQLHAAKWKGEWYLRSQNQCVEVTLDKNGKSLLATSPQVIIEKVDGITYLTVCSMLEKHSYKMNKTDENIYLLEPVSTGPNQNLNKLKDEDAYFGLYRKIVECQLGAEE
ncbi:MAG: hypothetical protein ABH859_06490 [Pseudomonadota bacterium]